MPYRYAQYRGQEARHRATEKPPIGPGFSDEEASSVDRLEVWASFFSDQGSDYTDWKLFDEKGRLLTERRIRGY